MFEKDIILKSPKINMTSTFFRAFKKFVFLKHLLTKSTLNLYIILLYNLLIYYASSLRSSAFRLSPEVVRGCGWTPGLCGCLLCLLPIVWRMPSLYLFMVRKIQICFKNTNCLSPEHLTIRRPTLSSFEH